jgi:hypothetical protein
MKIIFNDILSSSSSPVESAGEVKFISSGLIFEKKLVLAQVFNTVQDLIDAYLKLSNEDERRKLYESPEAEKILNDPANRKEFNNKTDIFRRSKPGSSKTGDVVSDAAQFGIDEAEFAGSPASKFGPFMEKKDQIIQKLRPFMSDKDIGEVFFQLEEQVKLPFTEVVGILEDVISKARSCNADVSKVVDFFIKHYGQKRQYSLTKELITDACELQKLNPVIDIFGVLTDAISGNQPEVGLMYALKDPDAMKVFNNLIMLSQSNAPEQSEEVRRKSKESSDALNNIQQKVNMQRALYDMMKIEETNKQLVEQIKILGSTFEFLLTQPMYRALRDMLYDLRAGKIILNQAASIFTGDRSPETKRSTPQEQSIMRDNSFPQISEERQPFAKNGHKFVKLASPEVTRYIYSQTAPKASQQELQEAQNGFAQILQAIDTEGRRVVDEMLRFLGNIPIVKNIANFFGALYKAFTNLLNGLKSGNITSASVAQAFDPILQGIIGATFDSNTAVQETPSSVVNPNIDEEKRVKQTFPDAYKKPDGFWYIKRNGVEQQILVSQSNPRLAQRSPQQGTTYIGGDKTKDLISNTLSILGTIGATILAGVGITKAATSLKREGSITTIFNSVAPLVKILLNICQEIFFSLNIYGRNAPVSSQFYNPDGTLSNRGKQTLVNARETMISLGISDQDAMALSKFKVEKEYLMQFLNKKEQNLKDMENQYVQTGSGSTESTVGTLPQDYQTKINEFIVFCDKLEDLFMTNLNLFRNGITNAKKQYDSIQSTHIEGELEEYKADLLTVQKKKAEWISLQKNAARMLRKRILMQKLKPLQLQMDTMKKLGIPMANIIASPNGILAMSGAIRREVAEAINELRKQHEELSNLIKSPDKISQFVKYPTDTGVTKLPESPDQSDSNQSPFEAPEGSQFRTEQNANSGVKNV